MIKDIKQIFKENYIDLHIRNLGGLLEVSKLFPDDFSHIHFEYLYQQTTKNIKYSTSEVMDNIDLINLKFIKIFQSTILSPDEFQFW